VCEESCRTAVRLKECLSAEHDAGLATAASAAKAALRQVKKQITSDRKAKVRHVLHVTYCADVMSLQFMFHKFSVVGMF